MDDFYMETVELTLEQQKLLLNLPCTIGGMYLTNEQIIDFSSLFRLSERSITELQVLRDTFVLFFGNEMEKLSKVGNLAVIKLSIRLSIATGIVDGMIVEKGGTV